jgi:glutamyl-tRNA reductase
MKLFVAGLSYKTAPVELREQLAVAPTRLRCAGCRLKIGSALSETVVLSTCNRVEIYGVADKVNGNVPPLFKHLAGRELDVQPYLYVHEGEEAVKHLLSVAGGMDSMVIGETEITGQVKHAYQAAQEARLTGRVLNRVFQKALQTAKEIRTRTGIGRGATSVGSVALELAEKVFGGDLARKSVMIIGAGKMGEACVKHLAKRGVKSVLVSNRSFDRAQALATEFGGRAVRLEECFSAMTEADIVISSTGARQAILHREEIEGVMKTRRDRPLVFIDIAVPRDIEPDVQMVPSVYLYDIDDLEAIVQENVRHREQELAQCRAIIEEETAAVMAKLTEAPRKPQSNQLSALATRHPHRDLSPAQVGHAHPNSRPLPCVATRPWKISKIRKLGVERGASQRHEA